jgi:hypothetical protein
VKDVSVRARADILVASPYTSILLELDESTFVGRCRVKDEERGLGAGCLDREFEEVHHVLYIDGRGRQCSRRLAVSVQRTTRERLKKWVPTVQEFTQACYRWDLIAPVNTVELNTYPDAN